MLAGYRCERCEGKRDLEVHHRTYERLGREWDQDLEVLCCRCHERETIVQTARSQHGIYLQVAAQVWRHSPSPGVMKLLSHEDAIELCKRLCAQKRIPYRTEPIVRALRLVAGGEWMRVPSPEPKPAWKPDPAPLSRSEADALIAELLEDRIGIKTMGHPIDHRAHEEKVRAQAADFQRRYPPKRRPLAERLAEIFS
jgi:hypothetical protein